MSANLERICTVDISIATPISNDANFDNILIIGPYPKAPKSAFPEVSVYNSLDELTSTGVVAIGADADPIGVAARVAFSQSPRPHEIYIATLPAPAAPVTATVSDVLDNALGMNGWYCVCPAGLSKDELVEAIQWTETQNKICGYPDNDPDNPIVQAGLYMRSFPIFTKEDENIPEFAVSPENKYGMAAAMAVKAMNFHAGEETWAMKQLATVSPAKISSTFIKKLESQNISFLLTIASKNITQGAKTNGGEWIDVIRFRDWLQNDMQVRIVNLLVTNPKIPYTDNGITLVENQMIASLKAGQYYGGISPTEYDEDGNEIPGFVTSVPLAANIPATQKASRVLSDCKFTARIAGAIHVVNVKGCLTYDNL